MGRLLVLLLVPALFVLLGCLFLSGRGAGWIAGYNTMPLAEREKYDERKICRFMGWMMFYIAGCVALWEIGEHLSNKGLFAAGLILLVAGIGFMFIYANTGNRFLKR